MAGGWFDKPGWFGSASCPGAWDWFASGLDVDANRPVEFPIRRCSRCGLVFSYDPRMYKDDHCPKCGAIL